MSGMSEQEVMAEGLRLLRLGREETRKGEVSRMSVAAVTVLLSKPVGCMLPCLLPCVALPVCSTRLAVGCGPSRLVDSIRLFV